MRTVYDAARQQQRRYTVLAPQLLAEAEADDAADHSWAGSTAAAATRAAEERRSVADTDQYNAQALCRCV